MEQECWGHKERRRARKKGRGVEGNERYIPELDTELVVLVEWLCSVPRLGEVLALVLVPSSAVFLKKLCCRA